MEFKDLKISDNLKTNLMLEGFLTPTLVQEKSLNFALNNKDMIIKSVTGSGKTLVYILTILNKIEKNGVQALVILPTRELAMQVKEQFLRVNKNTNLKVSCVYGGSDFTRQRYDLKDANIVIGTPGRLIDHIERRTLKLHNLKVFVLDEADEMLDMGFIDDIKRIIKATPKYKQNLMLSATFDEKVKALAESFLNEPVIIETSVENKVVKDVKQTYVKCLKKGKFETLVKFLNNNTEKTLIFVNTKKMAEELYTKLKKCGINSIYLHGDLTQNERKKSLNLFKNNENILIATDVASRGLDIKDIEFVINYDIPKESEIYIHRVGRTARAGKTGMSLSLINSTNQLEFIISNFSEYNLVELSVQNINGQTCFVENKNPTQYNFEKRERESKPTKKLNSEFNFKEKFKDKKQSNNKKEFKAKYQKDKDKAKYKNSNKFGNAKKENFKSENRKNRTLRLTRSKGKK